MPYIDHTIHPLRIWTVSRPLSAETRTQLLQYCHRVEHDESRTYHRSGVETRYRVRLYGLRDRCELLAEMLVLPHV